MFKHNYTLNLGRISTILVAALLIVSCSATKKVANEGRSDATAYLADEDLPDATVFLPSPSKPGDALFAGDLAYYAWGKSVRSSQRGTVAHDDASSSMSYIAKRMEPA